MTHISNGVTYEYVPKDEHAVEEFQCNNGCAFRHTPDNEGCPEDAKGRLLCNEDTSKVWKKVEIVKKPEQTKQEEPAQGRKYDSGKPMYNLIPADALEEVVKVLTYGAIKYNEPIDQENWRLVDNPHPRYHAAAQRHQWADWKGEEVDPESNLYHIAHAISSLMFRLQLKIEQNKQNKGNK